MFAYKLYISMHSKILSNDAFVVFNRLLENNDLTII